MPCDQLVSQFIGLNITIQIYKIITHDQIKTVVPNNILYTIQYCQPNMVMFQHLQAGKGGKLKVIVLLQL